MITENDNRTRRCPRLGHDLSFSYCRKPGDEIPCPKIFDCWWESFDIKAFMEENYPDDIIKQVNKPPELKTQSLLELIQEVEKRVNKK